MCHAAVALSHSLIRNSLDTNRLSIATLKLSCINPSRVMQHPMAAAYKLPTHCTAQFPSRHAVNSLTHSLSLCVPMLHRIPHSIRAIRPSRTFSSSAVVRQLSHPLAPSLLPNKRSPSLSLSLSMSLSLSLSLYVSLSLSVSCCCCYCGVCSRVCRSLSMESSSSRRPTSGSISSIQ